MAKKFVPFSCASVWDTFDNALQKNSEKYWTRASKSFTPKIVRSNTNGEVTKRQNEVHKTATNWCNEQKTQISVHLFAVLCENDQGVKWQIFNFLLICTFFSLDNKGTCRPASTRDRRGTIDGILCFGRTFSKPSFAGFFRTTLSKTLPSYGRVHLFSVLGLGLGQSNKFQILLISALDRIVVFLLFFCIANVCCRLYRL